MSLPSVFIGQSTVSSPVNGYNTSTASPGWVQAPAITPPGQLDYRRLSRSAQTYKNRNVFFGYASDLMYTLLVLSRKLSKGANVMNREEVQKALDLVRPQLQADGGDAEIVEITDDGIVKLRLKGACGGCPMSQMTLKMGIERVLKERIPEVKSVESV